jgi:hypothetical protein
MLIEDWLKRMEATNPGTATRFERYDDNRFRRAYIMLSTPSPSTLLW